MIIMIKVFLMACFISIATEAFRIAEMHCLFAFVCVCVCVCARARTHARACKTAYIVAQ
jgi:hypothetical protein